MISQTSHTYNATLAYAMHIINDTATLIQQICEWQEEDEYTKGVNKIRKSRRTQWSKEKGQQDNQRCTKQTYETKDQVTRTASKTRGEFKTSEG